MTKHDTMVKYVSDRCPEFAPRQKKIPSIYLIPAAIEGRRAAAYRIAWEKKFPGIFDAPVVATPVFDFMECY